MFRAIRRMVVLLFLGWFAFVFGALIFAARKRQAIVAQDPQADEIDLVASFGPLEFHSEAGAFRGGSITTWFGGGTVDLSDATLDPAGATIRTSTLFGGGNLIVPDGWKVETHVMGIGGVGDARPPADRPDDAPTLHLEGTAIFGGWGIMSSAPGHNGKEPVTV